MHNYMYLYILLCFNHIDQTEIDTNQIFTREQENRTQFVLLLNNENFKEVYPRKFELGFLSYSF